MSSGAAAETTVRRQRLAVGAVSTRLVEAGPREAGEAMVFLHGNPGSADDWVRLAGAVGAGGRRAVAFDLPDFGETEAAPGFEHSTAGYAGFVGEALAALGIERVHLVLHDFGGPIGLVRHRHPARLPVADAGADLAHPGARRGLPGDHHPPRLRAILELYRATDDPGEGAPSWRR